MNARLEKLKQRARKRTHKKFRHDIPKSLVEDAEIKSLAGPLQLSRCMKRVLEMEKPLILPDERIVFTRTAKPLPYCAGAGNICGDWPMALDQGLLKRREVALATRQRMKDDKEAVEFSNAAIETIDAVLDLAKRYAKEARKKGKGKLAKILDWVPAHQPRNFHEALQSLKFLHGCIWLSGSMHVGLGRFDQYMWPYYKEDIDSGKLNKKKAEELMAEFFISLNKDTDLYPGVQIGDNGQSMMLGGMTRDGQDGVNDLTWMVIRVSQAVNMIDPKVNLRVNKNTSLELLKEAAKLTRCGLGFPQYANDEVEIPALAAHGYDIEDARDYTVAACWEFIIPGRAMDVPNIAACSFPSAADKAIRAGLKEHESFDQIMERTRVNIKNQVDNYVDGMKKNSKWSPSPYYSVLLNGCLEKGRDVNRGGVKYYNYGIHGAGAANGADALAAVRKFVFEDKSIKADDLLEALESNYENDGVIRKKLHEQGPKVGNNDDTADKLMTQLFDWFSDACEAIKDNGRGGIVRPGTGTAMYYVWLVRKPEGAPPPEPYVAASADGRKEGEFISSSLAPSPGIKVRGPISVLQSFSKIDYHRVCNGGPITMELSDTVFRNEESLEKVAMLIRTFVQLGCQQLQLNALNVETLKDAKKHPEKYKNLVVRVWGWSGYFVELDQEYQDHIITRNMYAI